MIKTIALASSAVAALTAAPVQAWWDNGHMLVGEVAAMLMKPEDVATIENVLSAWETDFPNTAKIATASIWADLVRCNTPSPFCDIAEKLPSFNAMDKWHYVNLPLFTNGARWGDSEPDLSLFNKSLDGEADVAVEAIMRTFNTTKSLWSANLALRQLIHIVGDVHNPMHAVGGVDSNNPTGDRGGNNWRFVSNCVATANNLHALFDAAGGAYIENWSLKFDTKVLEANATELIKLAKLIADPINMASITSLPYSQFFNRFNRDGFFRRFMLESYETALKFIYPQLDKTTVSVVNNQPRIACPPASYIEHAAQISKQRIALAGKRLSVLLTKIAPQLRSLNPKL